MESITKPDVTVAQDDSCAMGQLAGVEKAAVLMLALGEDMAVYLLKHMNDQEIQRISNQMLYLRDVKPDLVEQVLVEFEKMAVCGNGMLGGGLEYIKKLLFKALAPEKATSILDNLTMPALQTGLEALRWLDPKLIARFVQGEHPQTVAVIIAHLDAEQAGAVMRLLSPQFQLDVLIRIAKLDRISPAVLQDLNLVLQREFCATGTVEKGRVGGVQTVAEILNHVDQASEREILGHIAEINGAMAEEIRRLMFVFEDLLNADDRVIQQILREISNDELALALKTASPELQEKLLCNLSQCAAETLREELEVAGPVRLSDVEKAQQKVVRVAKRLETEGKVILGGKGDDDFV